MHIIKNEPNPIFETLWLLHTSQHGQEFDELFIQSLSDLGLDGKEIFETKFDDYRKYVHSFTENRKDSEFDDFFFGEPKESIITILLFLLIDMPELFDDFEAITDEKINEYLVAVVGESLQMKEEEYAEIITFEQIFSLLMSSPLPDGMKWKLSSVMREPRKYIGALVEQINDNLPNFEAAYSLVKDNLAPFIKDYERVMENKSDKAFFDLVDKAYDDEVTIYPTIIQPVILMALTGSAYYGLLVDSIIRGDSYESRKNTMLMQFKVLSDNSKFTILRSIKEEPKYSTQLVEELHLSAS
ncbi:MAG: hypothetical protein LBV67_03575, partial [Streptococcaceae bacterium]|nr:hypothetical protein [Streptococcaceae bacterium]